MPALAASTLLGKGRAACGPRGRQQAGGEAALTTLSPTPHAPVGARGLPPPTLLPRAPAPRGDAALHAAPGLASGFSPAVGSRPRPGLAGPAGGPASARFPKPSEGKNSQAPASLSEEARAGGAAAVTTRPALTAPLFHPTPNSSAPHTTARGLRDELSAVVTLDVRLMPGWRSWWQSCVRLPPCPQKQTTHRRGQAAPPAQGPRVRPWGPGGTPLLARTSRWRPAICTPSPGLGVPKELEAGVSPRENWGTPGGSGGSRALTPGCSLR